MPAGEWPVTVRTLIMWLSGTYRMSTRGWLTWRTDPFDLGYNVLQSCSYHQLPAVFAEVARPLGVRVTTEEELGSAFAAAAQAQRDGRRALIEVVLNPTDVSNVIFRFPYPPAKQQVNG